jgi:hypothetical protein
MSSFLFSLLQKLKSRDAQHFGSAHPPDSEGRNISGDGDYSNQGTKPADFVEHIALAAIAARANRTLVEAHSCSLDAWSERTRSR